MGLWLRKLGVFTLWHFAVVSQLRNESHYAAKWHSCAKSWFHSCKTPCEMGLWLRIFIYLFFLRISQPFRSCEMRFTVLRNEVHCAAKWHSCAKMCFAAAKYPAEWSFGCEIGNFHALELRSCETAAKWGLLCWEVALVCQNWFRSCENFRR